MSKTAYDSILEYSSQQQFGDFRRVLIGNRGTIASGNMATGMKLRFDKNKNDNAELFEGNLPKKTPINIVQNVGSRGSGMPGLIFNRAGYDEVRRQIGSQGGSLDLTRLLNGLEFDGESDELIWGQTTDTTKRRCISKNIEKLIKETATQYRVHGDRMHYLVVGLVELVDDKGTIKRFPLFLFSCPDLELNRLKGSVDATGFINFWLDKNVFNGEISNKTNNNYEVTLDADFTTAANTIASYMNNVNLSSQFRSVKIDPSYMAFQIVSGFDAEYVDPAWGKILAGENHG